MKIIMESWRGYVDEQEAEPEAQEAEVGSNEIETVGQLRDALRTYKLQKTGKSIGKRALKSVLPGFVKQAYDAGMLAKSLYGGDLSDKKSLPGLEKMQVDPDVSKIVDDKIEAAFLKFLDQDLQDENPETRIDNYDTTQKLQDFIASHFNKKTVHEQSENKEQDTEE